MTECESSPGPPWMGSQRSQSRWLSLPYWAVCAAVPLDRRLLRFGVQWWEDRRAADDMLRTGVLVKAHFSSPSLSMPSLLFPPLLSWCTGIHGVMQHCWRVTLGPKIVVIEKERMTCGRQVSDICDSWSPWSCQQTSKAPWNGYSQCRRCW